jgi:hypothetical protein
MQDPVAGGARPMVREAVTVAAVPGGPATGKNTQPSPSPQRLGSVKSLNIICLIMAVMVPPIRCASPKRRSVAANIKSALESDLSR